MVFLIRTGKRFRLFSPPTADISPYRPPARRPNPAHSDNVPSLPSNLPTTCAVSEASSRSLSLRSPLSSSIRTAALSQWSTTITAGTPCTFVPECVDRTIASLRGSVLCIWHVESSQLGSQLRITRKKTQDFENNMGDTASVPSELAVHVT